MTKDTLGFNPTKILNALSKGPSYGYEIAKNIRVGQPGVHATLKKFEKSGYVSTFWGDERPGYGNPRRRYYELTATGTELLENTLEAYRRILGDTGPEPTNISYS